MTAPCRTSTTQPGRRCHHQSAQNASRRHVSTQPDSARLRLKRGAHPTRHMAYATALLRGCRGAADRGRSCLAAALAGAEMSERV